MKHAAEQWQGKKEEWEEGRVEKRRIVPLAQVYLHICPACPFSLLKLFIIRKKTKRQMKERNALENTGPQTHITVPHGLQQQ